jgi:hypothetical protein
VQRAAFAAAGGFAERARWPAHASYSSHALFVRRPTHLRSGTRIRMQRSYERTHDTTQRTQPIALVRPRRASAVPGHFGQLGDAREVRGFA